MSIEGPRRRLRKILFPVRAFVGLKIVLNMLALVFSSAVSFAAASTVFVVMADECLLTIFLG